MLLTGAGGFIGRTSIEPLRAAGYEVHAVVSPAGDATVEPLRQVDVRRADLLDSASVDALIESVRPTHLLHFAWVATPGEYRDSAENYRWLSAGRNLLSAFARHGGERAVLAGSCAEYDWSRVGICHEQSSPLASDGRGRLSAYAECKSAMQRSLVELGRAHGFSTAWGRIFFLFGPGEHRERLVASVITRLLAGCEASATHGRQIRSFLHVCDVGAAFAALLASDVEGVVNIGSGEEISIAELLGRIARSIGRPDLLRLGARVAPPEEPAVLVPDIGRLRDEVGFTPRWTLDEGLADTIRWWRERLDRPTGTGGQQ